MHEMDNPNTQRRVLASVKEQLRVTAIEKIGSGNEFYIYRVELPDGPAVIKLPKDRIFSNVNDTHIDSRTLLKQEFTLMRHVSSCGVTQIPKPITELQAENFGALVMSFVQGDDSKADEFKLGQILAHIHSIPPPKLSLSAQENSEIPELIANRLRRRWQELRNFAPDLGDLPDKERLIATLEPIRSIKVLLHMDFRQANFRTHDGKVTAILDWSNALIGHPALELARVAETGETGGEFLRGYESVKQLVLVSRDIEQLFRLDTATMLALVFLSEDPDPERASFAVKRVR